MISYLRNFWVWFTVTWKWSHLMESYVSSSPSFREEKGVSVNGQSLISYQASNQAPASTHGRTFENYNSKISSPLPPPPLSTLKLPMHRVFIGGDEKDHGDMFPKAYNLIVRSTGSGVRWSWFCHLLFVWLQVYFIFCLPQFHHR